MECVDQSDNYNFCFFVEKRIINAYKDVFIDHHLLSVIYSDVKKLPITGFDQVMTLYQLLYVMRRNMMIIQKLR